MSYLIQNFSYLSPSLRMTLRTKSSILVRNYSLINLLAFSTAMGFNVNFNSWAALLIYVKLTKDSFYQFSKVALPKSKLFKYSPIGINYPRVAYYTALTNIDLMLDKEVRNYKFLPLTSNYFLNPYFTKFLVAITPVSDQSANYQFHKFLRLVLYVWFCWPKKFKISTNFTWISDFWFQLRFLNRYYFKVYTV